MEPIRSFNQLTAHLRTLNRRKRIAVVCANDPNTEYAIARALEEGIAEFLMIGDSSILEKYQTLKNYPRYVKTVHVDDPDEAAREAVRIVREGGADILMKGIINTDNLLRAILDKEHGLLPKGRILTHLAVMQIPTYDKLLFFSDAAVIPRPTLQQRIEMIGYALGTCRHFGIEQPRVALIHC
ncbi:phosphate acyltransferase, partial [Bacteroides heparinolyticus]